MMIGRKMCGLVLCLWLFVIGVASQEIGTKEAPPKTVSSVDPDYGDSVKNYGMAGSVSVYVQIDKKGKASVQRAFGPLVPCSDLDSPHVEAIRKAVTDAAAATVFERPIKDGKPTDVYMNLTYRFAPQAAAAENSSGETKPTTISGGVLNGRASKMPSPAYPPAARANRVSGAVSIQVLLSETGEVMIAGAVSGHPLLHEASVEVACRAKFPPTLLQGKPVRVSGVLTYNFAP